MPKRVIHSIKRTYELSSPDDNGNYRVDEETVCGKYDRLLRNDSEVLTEAEHEKIRIDWQDVPRCKKCEKIKQANKDINQGVVK